MLRSIFVLVILCFCGSALSQAPTPDESLLVKTRALYDAPFTRDIVSFDCAVQFDWSKHFADFLGAVPPAAEPTVARLQAVQHRVFVNRSGAVVSAIPKDPGLAGAKQATELEQMFTAMIPAGLNAWLPSSMNVILPVGPTKFSFEKIDPGYKLSMKGPGVASTLLLAEDLRITSVVSQLPPLRSTSEFTSGPNGFLLASLKTSPTTDPSTNSDAVFAYTYQAVEGFQLPSLVTITGSTGKRWHYSLTDCKVMTGVHIEVGLPKR